MEINDGSSGKMPRRFLSVPSTKKNSPFILRGDLIERK